MSISEALGVLENKHCIAIMLALIDGPRTKMELYGDVSKNPRMPEKIEDLERIGLVTTWTVDRRATMVSLTDKGERVAGMLSEIDGMLDPKVL